jgi:gamma-glutamyl hydrolase
MHEKPWKMSSRHGLALIVPLLIFAVVLFVAYYAHEDDRDTSLRIKGEVAFLLKHNNLRPVVGILTQPRDDGREYIAASYVKYAEAAGARVMPLRYWWSEKELKKAFKSINGLLFPGGGASLDPENSKILRAASILYQEAEKSNKMGLRFPIWGTCLGWELLATLASDYSVLKDSGKFLHPGMSSPIREVVSSSRMFHGMSKKLLRAVGKEQVLFYFSHEFGVTPQLFHDKLDSRCWKINALGNDLTGKYFVSAAESTCRPYFGVQFHPEKPLFEWYSKVSIPHSFDSNEVSRHFIAILDQELRWSRPTHLKESEAFANDIHQFPITTNGDQYFFQEYIFPSENSISESENSVDDTEWTSELESASEERGAEDNEAAGGEANMSAAQAS